MQVKFFSASASLSYITLSHYLKALINLPLRSSAKWEMANANVKQNKTEITAHRNTA